MGETFYTVLGVSPDADDAAVRWAYRETVKECHPDVSDDPAAGDRFKRLTTARDVLLDDDERTRYDRLGHDAYVRQQVDSSVWEASEDTPEEGAHPGQNAGPAWSTPGSTGPDAGRTTTTSTGRRGPGGGSGSAASRRQRRWNERRHSRADGGRDPPWQRAPDAYQRTETARRVDSRTSVLDALRAIGPWLIIHFVLITSALTTSGFMLGIVGTDPAGTVATGLFSLLLVGVALLLSFLHVLSNVS